MAQTQKQRQPPQEAMQKRNDNLAGNSKIDVGSGFFIATKMTLGGMIYMEDQFGKPAGEIKPGESTRDIVTMLTALGISANPDMPHNEVRAKILQIDRDRMDSIISQLPDIEPKNPTRGNLVEKKS